MAEKDVEREMAPGEDKMRRPLVFQEFPSRNRGKRSPGPRSTIRDRKPKKFKIQIENTQPGRVESLEPFPAFPTAAQGYCQLCVKNRSQEYYQLCVKKLRFQEYYQVCVKKIRSQEYYQLCVKKLSSSRS